MGPRATLPAAVGDGLVRDLPDTVDPQQIVEVNPALGLVSSRVNAELHSGSITHLRHRYNSANDVTAGDQPARLSAEDARLTRARCHGRRSRWRTSSAIAGRLGVRPM